MQGFIPETIGHYDKRIQKKHLDTKLLLHEKRHLFMGENDNKQMNQKILNSSKNEKEDYAKKSIQYLLRNVRKK
jgi:hypothetical protein